MVVLLKRYGREHSLDSLNIIRTKLITWSSIPNIHYRVTVFNQVSIAREINRILKEEYVRARDTLKDHRQQLELLTEAILDKKTLKGEDIEELLKDSKTTQKKETLTPTKTLEPPPIDPLLE